MRHATEHFVVRPRVVQSIAFGATLCNAEKLEMTMFVLIVLWDCVLNGYGLCILSFVDVLYYMFAIDEPQDRRIPLCYLAVVSLGVCA